MLAKSFLFVNQLLKGWGYPVTTLDMFLLKLFDKYAELLKKRFSDDFQEVCDNGLPLFRIKPHRF